MVFDGILKKNYKKIINVSNYLFKKLATRAVENCEMIREQEKGY